MATRLIETRHGRMLAFEGDQFMTPTLVQRGEYSPQERAMLEQLVRPGLPVVEVGANIGVHTLPLARRCAPAPLIAFEPQPRVFQVLCANLALNDLANVLAYPDACGEAEGFASVPLLDYEARGNFGGVSVQAEEQPGIRVRVVTLDSFELPVLGLLKIDVEGFEPQVLRGAAATIARCRPMIYCENDRPDQQDEVIQLLAGFGYRLYWHTPALSDPEVFGGYNLISVNVLAVPEERGTVVTGAQAIDPASWTSPVRAPPGQGVL